jgi:hypothetical protein
MTLHIAPSDSAGGSLREAISLAGLDEEVLACRDDLSCGPIATGDAAERAAWWARYHDDANDGHLALFWERVTGTSDRLVLWTSRLSAQEHACFLACVDRLGDHPYQVIDVTPGKVRVSHLRGEKLRPLIGSEQPLSAEARMQASMCWRKLKAENAPFRLNTPDGLVSGPIDCFDAFLVQRTPIEGERIILIVSEVMGIDADGQVGNVLLVARVVALVEAGKLVADGDPWDWIKTRIKRPRP